MALFHFPSSAYQYFFLSLLSKKLHQVKPGRRPRSKIDWILFSKVQKTALADAEEKFRVSSTFDDLLAAAKDKERKASNNVDGDGGDDDDSDRQSSKSDDVNSTFGTVNTVKSAAAAAITVSPK